MKKPTALALLCCLLAALAAGCGAPRPAASSQASSSAPASSAPAAPVSQASVPAASSVPEPSPFDDFTFELSRVHYDAAEEWQRQYYDKAIELLEADTEGSFWEISLYYASGTPYVQYASGRVPPDATNHENRYSEIYRCTGSGLEQVYAGFCTDVIINTKTGNMVVGTCTDEEIETDDAGTVTQRTYRWDEMTPGGPVPLYSRFRTYISTPAASTYSGLYRDGPTDITHYFYAENRYYTDLEASLQQPEYRLPLMRASESMPISGGPNRPALSPYVAAELTKARISDFFLDTYNPAIPISAPDWVYDYMKFVRLNYLYSYFPSAEYKASYGSPFFVRLAGTSQNAVAPILITNVKSLFEDAIIHHDNRVDMLHGSNDYVEAVAMDSNGQLIIKINSYLSRFYYSLNSQGMNYLCGGGPLYLSYTPHYSGDESRYHMNGQIYIAEEDTSYSPDEFYRLKLNPYLSQYGYTPPLAEPESATLEAPEVLTWESFEPVLIEFICAYARENGYM